MIFSRALWWGVGWDVGPAPPCFYFLGCGLQRGVCRDVGPAPTLAFISVGCGLQQGVCRDVGPAPTLAVLSCGLWASAGRVSGRRSCSDPCFNSVGCGLQRGVCRDVGPAPTLAITWAVGFWRGVCRDVGPAPTLAITSVVGWALRSSASNRYVYFLSRALNDAVLQIQVTSTEECHEPKRCRVSFAHFLGKYGLIFLSDCLLFCTVFSYIKLFT